MRPRNPGQGRALQSDALREANGYTAGVESHVCCWFFPHAKQVWGD
jgi:hypothetical protein